MLTFIKERQVSLKCIIFSFLVFFSLVFPAAGDQTLQDTGILVSMKTALKKNPLVLAAWDEVAAAGRDLSSDKFKRLPTLSFTGETEGSRETEALLRAVQPLWVGGRISNAISESEIGLAQSRAELRQVQRDIMEDTAVAYANLLGLDARIRAADKNIAEYQKLLDLISRRKKGQVASEADVGLARSRLSTARLIREELWGNRQTIAADLEALTLTPVPELIPVPGQFIELPETGAIEEVVVETSPAITGTMLAIDQARIQKAQTRSEMMPTISLRLDQEVYDRASLSDQDLDTRLGLVVEGSLEGVGLTLYQAVKAAEQRIQRARMTAHATENSLRRDIRSLVSDRQMALALVRLNQDLLSTTQATLNSYLRQYEAGRKSWLDLLNIQQEFGQARLALEQVRSTLLQYSLRLCIRTGQLDSLIEAAP